MGAEAQIPGREMSVQEFRHICHRYFKASELVKGKRVLDVGCGAGLGLKYLSFEAEKVVGTDLSEENILIASTNCSEKISVFIMDAHSLAFPEKSFDVVLAMEVIQYLRLGEFLSQVRKVLAPGGTLFLCLPNQDRPQFTPGRGTTKYYSSDELYSQLLSEGFESRIYGVFQVPCRARNAVSNARSGILGVSIRVLDLFAPLLPVRRLKDIGRQLVRYKPVKLKFVLEEGDMAGVKDVHMEVLNSADRDTRNFFLYAFATRPTEGQLP